MFISPLLGDTCHSGSMLDLPFFVDHGQVRVENTLIIPPRVICFSACTDTQSAMDDIGQKGYSGGLVAALTDWVLKRSFPSQPKFEHFLFGSYGSVSSRMRALGQTLVVSLSRADSFRGGATDAPAEKRTIALGMSTRGAGQKPGFSWVFPLLVVVFLIAAFLMKKSRAGTSRNF